MLYRLTMFTDTLASTGDPLSKTLMKMRLKAFLNVALDCGGNWAVDFPGENAFSFNVIQKGECWLAIAKNTYHLRSGDCVLITGGTPFVLAKDLAIKRRVRPEQFYEHAHDGVVTLHGGGDFFCIGTVTQFEGHLPKILFGRLPPLIHIPADSDQAAVMRWGLERFSAEFRGHGAGRSLILNHLAPIMFLQTLRVYLASAKNDKNWLVALSDPKLSKAIEAMHTDYERPLSLEGLAKIAGMSRSGFALSFKQKVGIAPMDYLTNWRMQIACELLQSENESLSSIASAVGYESQSAFSTAFKKIVRVRPGAYQKSLSAA